MIIDAHAHYHPRRFVEALQRMGVNDDSMVIILNLIDQVHGLRRLARTLLAEAVVQSGRTG